MKHFNIKVSGKVQGVWFRRSTFQKANELGVFGTVKNMPDGSVEIRAEGEETALQKLLDWCRNGPEHAAVEDVTYSEEGFQGYKDFSIS